MVGGSVRKARIPKSLPRRREPTGCGRGWHPEGAGSGAAATSSMDSGSALPMVVTAVRSQA